MGIALIFVGALVFFIFAMMVDAVSYALEAARKEREREERAAAKNQRKKYVSGYGVPPKSGKF